MSWIEYDDFEDRSALSAKVEKALKQRRAAGENLEPVVPASRKNLSTTFWGQAWNRNLVAYSDYESRLPRGRTYLRSGKVLGLQVKAGEITSLVIGTRLYEVQIRIKPLAEEKWVQLQQLLRGKISDVVELLSGELSDDVMRTVTDLEHGLFPSDREIKFSCTCPDAAGLCKHVAATFYAVGCLLDDQPQKLFTLRGLDPTDLIGTLQDTIAQLTDGSSHSPARAEALADEDLSALFGIDLSDADQAP